MNGHLHTQQLLDFIDASPSPWHVVANMVERLGHHGFQALDETEHWQLQAGGRYYVVRGDSSLIAFRLGQKPLSSTGFKIIGAHTDSPGLRIRPNAGSCLDGFVRLGVEIYGGPILATFTDRDLGLAGRLSYKTSQGSIANTLVCFDRPLLRLPNLAIHLNRGVNDDGLKLQKQNELPLLLARWTQEQLPPDYFQSLLAQQAGITGERILAWDLAVYDTQPGAFWGANQEFYADSQLDNLASCHAGLTALLDDAVLENDGTQVCAFFDHEEIGSESHKGAAGSFLPDILQRIAIATDTGLQAYHQTLAKSVMISADMAHAYQPNFPLAYEPEHKAIVNNGPVIKVNASRRYSSESGSEALFAHYCQEAGVPYQYYSHRCDLPCGSTIGPIVSAKLGIACVDVGNPLWAMHSIRESAGVLDHNYMILVLKRFFCG
ncbi:MAG: M18 family aminopeptidase [Methylovulum sp.]|uniref:M18 family aminopeptidase n=1 Tax=Methylovulum sp. TaxID=1916980 RepID=UPI00260C697F|nr:M18 family aminopeptidase [Methylovulum sp.]MDD2723192.1 M18 family aminopeptidase [Methylovulum sp.]MDD5123133.1 M18 family aminopeptidase [Methylovulum sp.]